jgi:hypothetical protein
MPTENPTTGESHHEIYDLADGDIIVQAKYGYHNPMNVNGPLGSVELILIEVASGKSALGEIVIQSLYGAGVKTKLQFDGLLSVNESTGLVNVTATGKGLMLAFQTKPQVVNATLLIELNPGYESGTVHVDGLLSGYALTATSVQIN